MAEQRKHITRQKVKKEQTMTERQALSGTTDIRPRSNDSPFVVPQQHVPTLPDEHTLEQAQAIIISAQFLSHISVTYRPLDDGTYEVAPVGDNDFTTIVSLTHLCDAILSQITSFMESPVFIAQQIARLTAM
jgi:hypothetical protein